MNVYEEEESEQCHYTGDASPSVLSYVSGVEMPITTTLRITTPHEDMPSGTWPVFRLMVNIRKIFICGKVILCHSCILTPAILINHRMKMGDCEIQRMMVTNTKTMRYTYSPLHLQRMIILL